MKKTLLALAIAMLSSQAMADSVPPTAAATPAPAAVSLPVDSSAAPEPTEVEVGNVTVPEEFPKANLWKTVKSLQLGPQSGITKVLGAKKAVLWTRGFDDQKVAKLEPEEHHKIFEALGVPDSQMASLSRQLMEKYSKLPHAQTVALVGAVALEPALTRADQQRIEEWLNRVLSVETKDVVTRRQALLALALLPQPSDESVATVVKVYETSRNNWETFPVNQFVQYHAVDLLERPDGPQIRERLGAVPSLYTPGIMQDLSQQEPPAATPVLETEAASQ
ncbi:MAG: hypothetical protein J0I12_30000 [Candidatus Eremiobacteraeota bacterium]|nr:hypothetical protein [Candidatus Eremiobacteraeota bacterium]